MIKIIRKLLDICEHKWDIIHNEDISYYETWGNERPENPAYRIRHIILQCEKCGNVKHKKYKR